MNNKVLSGRMPIKCPDTRWSWVEVSLGALRRNTRAIKSLLSPKTKLMCVVKADAYGHGAVQCAKTMMSSGADQFAVATVLEGVALRKGGIERPILVLNEPPETAIDMLLEYRLMPSVYTQEFALALGERAASLDMVAEYHLAVDTGMTRIGVPWKNVVDFCQTIDFHIGLKRAGIFTHFATADAPDSWDFALQLDHFNKCIQGLKEAGAETGLVHCNNTSATILHTQSQMDMCRAGIALYGLYPDDTSRMRIKLEPVMSVKARITRVSYANVGDGVGYGYDYRVPKQNIQIATIPVGYADGLSRELSGRMKVLCNGQAFQQVGRICMDQCMFAVDVNTNRSFKPTSSLSFGDLVVVMGEDADERISADDIAALRGTINYEITCDFGMRLEKVYV